MTGDKYFLRILQRYFLRVYRMARLSLPVGIAYDVTEDIFRHVRENIKRIKNITDLDDYMFDLASNRLKEKRREIIDNAN